MMKYKMKDKKMVMNRKISRRKRRVGDKKERKKNTFIYKKM